jgi:hypothetical protein
MEQTPAFPIKAGDEETTDVMIPSTLEEDDTAVKEGGIVGLESVV